MRFNILHAGITYHAHHTPDHTAVEDEEGWITYGELNARANQIAHLVARDAARGDRVGVCMEKRIDAIAALYGVLKSGAVVVPLDPRTPSRRLSWIARDCSVRFLICDSACQTTFHQVLEEVPSLQGALITGERGERFRDSLGVRVRDDQCLDAQPRSERGEESRKHDLAYILYTSGSTGAPKGVMLSHRNVCSFVNWAVQEFAVSARDRLANHAPLHFDLSTFDVFASAFAGAAVVLLPNKIMAFPPRLRKFVRERRITIWYSVPSAITMFALRGGKSTDGLPCLRTILFAGEIFPPRQLFTVMEALPHTRFFNLYGPTETNVCTFYPVPPSFQGTEALPIGSPIEGVETFVVGESGECGTGEIGELQVAGPTVMRGYWNRSEKTSQALAPRPDGSAGLVYRTGDLVYRHTDGLLRFVGRRDDQVKVHGYRIELGEVEAAVYAHPDVSECAVCSVQEESSSRLVAFVVTEPDSRAPAGHEELLRWCAQHLPRYMVPSLFSLETSLPKTSTGKVDRRELLRQRNGK